MFLIVLMAKTGNIPSRYIRGEEISVLAKKPMDYWSYQSKFFTNFFDNEVTVDH